MAVILQVQLEQLGVLVGHQYFNNFTGRQGRQQFQLNLSTEVKFNIHTSLNQSESTKFINNDSMIRFNDDDSIT